MFVWIAGVVFILVLVFLLWPLRARALSLRLRWVVAALIVAALLLGGGLYAFKAGEMPAEDFAVRGVPLAEQHPEINTLIDGLKKKLAANPDNSEGWFLLARSEAAIGKQADAIAAYEKGMAVMDKVPLSVRGDYAEMLVMQAQQVTPDAHKIFAEILKEDGEDARALYYDALSREAAGDAPAAFAQLMALAAGTAKDAPFQPLLHEALQRMAQQYGFKLPDAKAAEAAGAKVAPGPSAADIQAASQMSAEDRQAMIEGMVAGLAQKLEENPQDVEGWQRLIRAYRVLGQEDKAKAAAEKLKALQP